MADQEIRNSIVSTMLRKGITGSHNRQIDTVVNWSVATHDRGKAKEEVERMVADPDIPVEKYGGQRDAIRLSSPEEAVAYLQANDGDVPFGHG